MQRRHFLKGIASGFLLYGMIGCTGGKNRSNRSQPNILFCIADDASYPHMGVYGCRWVNSPAFDRVAREGLLFNNAYTPNAKCAPSRASILTGRNSWQLEAAANHWPYFPAKFKTYAEALTDFGYFVGYTAKGWAPGVATDEDGKQRQLTGTPFNSQKTTPPAAHISNNDYAANFIDFYKAKPKNKPFCFWYGSTEPHRAYEYGAGIKSGKKITDVDRVFPFWPDNQIVRTDILDYAFEIDYFDLHLKKMLTFLQEVNDLNNTLVVVTADNGMPFPRIKGQEYEYSNHLPLAIMWKDGIKNPGRHVDDFVSFIDFAPTFLECAGLDQDKSGMQSIEGKSLTDIFFSSNEGTISKGREFVLIGKERHDIGRPFDWGYPIRGIVKGNYLYIYNFEINRWPAGNPETGYLNCDGSPTKTECINARKNEDTKNFWQWSFGKRPQEELYDIKNDRDCMDNLAENRKFSEIKIELKEKLFSELRRQLDPRMFGKGDIFDEYPYADEKHRFFYEKYKNGESLEAGWINKSDYDIRMD